MKLVILLLILTPLSFANPVQPNRRYLPEEEDPEFKRYIYLENNGKYELIDLKASENKTIKLKIQTSDVEYYLYTPKNRVSPFVITNNDVNSLSDSYFDPKRITMFVVHGWNNNRNSALNEEVKEALFAADYNINLFIVDWSGPANCLYLTAKNAVVPVGEVVGKFINLIQELYNLDGSSFVLVGHSLGAHVVGSAGATTNKKVANIIGLDPAGPLFSLKNPESRLDETDGQIVQIIHTNGNLLGFASSIGDIDYFPNGGMSQPGCGLDLAGTCSHSKAYKYLAEAIERGPVFQATLCTDYKNFQKGKCDGNDQSVMGEIEVKITTFGDYYLDTNSHEPYALA